MISYEAKNVTECIVLFNINNWLHTQNKRKIHYTMFQQSLDRVLTES
jgi:hypothetical protein